MINNPTDFWHKLPKPFFATAPMANVTDFVFRQMIAKYGKPDVIWAEFVSADGLVSKGKNKLLIDLKFSKKQKPVVAQLFGSNPEKMREAAEIVAGLGFDGIDINMGCPDRAIEKSGSGAAMIKDPRLAIEIISAARVGIVRGGTAEAVVAAHSRNTFATRAYATPPGGLAPRSISRMGVTQSVAFKKAIPVSVKTRLGYNKVDLGWIRLLLKQRLPALTIHLRTRKEMSEVAAHWELMPEIVKMRDEISPETLIIGNGDVMSVEEGREKAKKYGCDGIMIGRGVFGKPWFFAQSGSLQEKSPKERLAIMLEHAKLFDKTFLPSPRLRQARQGMKNFDVMKKHFKAYVSGWDGAKELRVKLMEAENVKEVARIVKNASATALFL